MSKSKVRVSGSLPIVGGFAAFERPNPAFVIPVSSAFYASVENAPRRVAESSDSPAQRPRDGCIHLQLIAPQLGIDNLYEYALGIASFNAIKTQGMSDTFIEVTLRTVLSLFEQLLPSDRIDVMMHQILVVRLVGDNTFYSMRKHAETRGVALERETLKSLPPFLKPADGRSFLPLGLGSSAAMTVALIAALFSHTGLLHIQPGSKRRPANTAKEFQLVHHVAQLCHALASKGAVSGLDICSSVYGGLSYVRFTHGELDSLVLNERVVSPQELLSIIQADSSMSSMGSTKMKWDYVSKPLSLPPGLFLVVAEMVEAFSGVDNMKKILNWKSINFAKGDEIWLSIRQNTELLIRNFEKLSQLSSASPEKYAASMSACGGTSWSNWDSCGGDLGRVLLQIRDGFNENHRILRNLTLVSNVPIEPMGLAKIMDATSELDGVLCVGVPSAQSNPSKPVAGGKGILFSIVISGLSASKVEQFWRQQQGAACIVLPIEATKGGIEWTTADF